MGALADFVLRKFGVSTRAIQDPVTVLCPFAASATLLRNNPDRLGFILVNLGVTAMYVAWDSTVSATHGIFIAPNGGSFGMGADEDGELVGWELHGRSVTSDNDIFIVVIEAA